MTRVIFRTDKAGDFKGDVTAIFPDFPERCNDATCYSHVGQHGTCSREWYRNHTRPATPEEFAPLLKELAAVGYNDLAIRKRWTASLASA
jgi:hypothetical protein